MKRRAMVFAACVLAAAVQGCSSEGEAGSDQSNLVGDPNAFGMAGSGSFGGTSGLPMAGTTGVGGTGGIGGTAGTGAPIAGMSGTAGMSAGGTFAPPPIAGTGGVGGAGGIGGAGGVGGAGGSAGSGGSVATARDPMIPTVSGDCPQFTNGTISFMGLSGITIVAGAKAPGPTAPMVFYWHGTGSQASEFNLMATAVRDGVVAEGGVLVSFQGTTGGDLLSGTSIFGAGDLNLVDQFVACAVRDHNVDPHRIFATGCSAGGLFSTAMAALRSGYVAAAAPNSGGFVFPQMFQTDYTPALMTMHGGPQDVVGVSFTTTSATADMTFSDRGGFVINCNHGGSHCGAASLAPQVWEFFKAHPYGVEPEPWTALPGDFPSYCAIY